MFRNPRESAPNPAVSEPLRALHPLPVIAWGPLALAYLGVPIVVGTHMFAVRDEDYKAAAQMLLNSGFRLTTPSRGPPDEVLNTLPDPEAVLEEINSGYRYLDRSSKTFDYPAHLPEREEQLVLMPNSFCRLGIDLSTISMWSKTTDCDVYGNMLYPSERILLESFVKAAVDDDSLSSEGGGYSDITSWGELLRSWVSMMVGYLGIGKDTIDFSSDKRAMDWYSRNFGRIYEEKNGPIDRRVTKRIGSGKEMAYDMAGTPIE
ncbi:hypothetical protein ETB97_000552 [Aspergillus alliaceus]|uniref:Uncharacterized protein n=1 Tax=Petromyces alliaceus TaxID=209559 RepID=A0A8H6A8A4_PETAA|nr:hypothetical protein ETB97_000552 [Aspergillus burnettii]